MNSNSKIVFITHPYFAINNPSNNLRIYKKAKNSDSWSYLQCKNIEEYSFKIKEYICGFFDYSRDEDKAYNNVPKYLKSSSDNMFEYFMGSKKSDSVMEQNKMKREEMAMLPNGQFLTDKDVRKMQKRWSDYIENSNIQLSVLSLNQDYVDENIDINDLQKKIATDLMPKFLSYMGYQKPKDNLEWVVALHNDRENNYHFHIAWVEKDPCFKYKNSKLGHRIQITLNDNEINFMKRQAALTIERQKLYTPALTRLGKDFDNLKTFFNPKDHNFTLKNINDIELENKIVRLGYVLEQIRSTDKKYIKYNSLPKNNLGKVARELTKEIKKELYKNVDIKKAKDKINNGIEEINNILVDIDKRNNISKIGFESAFENKLIKSKLEASENYISNAIVNHSLYNLHHNNENKRTIKIEDLIGEFAIIKYKKHHIKDMTKPTKKYKNKILYNVLSGRTYKNELVRTLDKLNYDQKKVAEEFYEMFEENNSYEK